MIVPIPYVHCGIGLVTALLSLPLVLRKIPMNHAYGIPIQFSWSRKLHGDHWKKRQMQ